MHEYSIANAIYQQVEAQRLAHGDAQVTAIHLRVGELSGVDAGLLHNAWSLLREGTACAGAPLHIADERARWDCPSCGAELERGALLRCPRCAVPGRLAQGDALLLERIEMEVEDHV